MSRLLRDRRGFFSLIELLVVLVIIMLATYLWLGGGSGPSGVPGYVSRQGGPTTTPGMALDAAVAVQCVENLRSIRQAVQAQQVEERPYPQTLADLGLPMASLRCPNTGQEYQYDPATGRVKCLTPGHGNY